MSKEYKAYLQRKNVTTRSPISALMINDQEKWGVSVRNEKVKKM